MPRRLIYPLRPPAGAFHYIRRRGALHRPMSGTNPAITFLGCDLTGKWKRAPLQPHRIARHYSLNFVLLKFPSPTDLNAHSSSVHGWLIVIKFLPFVTLLAKLQISLGSSDSPDVTSRDVLAKLLASCLPALPRRHLRDLRRPKNFRRRNNQRHLLQLTVPTVVDSTSSTFEDLE